MSVNRRARYQLQPHTNASGFSAISLDEKEIAISNLSTGVDLYSLESMSKTRSFVDTILPDTNYPIAVEFLANGSLVSSGSHTGRVCLWDKHSCAIFQVLDHGREFIYRNQHRYLNSGITQYLLSLFDALR